MQYLNGTTSQIVKATQGTLYGIIVNSHASGTIRFNDGASGTTSAGVKATGTLTASGTFSNGDTITIGDVTYTMRTALTSPAVKNEILIGAAALNSLDNIKLAVNAGSGEGTNYSTGTVANPKVTATTNTDTTQVVEARDIGTDGNSIVTTETGTNSAWGAATLESGAESSLLIINTYTFPTGSTSLVFNAGIDFHSALYVSKGGTIDYTLIYE